ncbi:MAG TPA: glycoside hydrolase family 27 protein [Acidobacteriaceae bacterium]|nr:glycoside hydrolase family 27 protein [Acidobacteriaceae bacterium]
MLVALAGAALGQDPTLAATPPMGWNSWNHFAGRVTAADVRAAADAMVANGMRDAGYIYVNIDDTWEGPRNAQGEITTNSKFPDMKALADYVHSKGMKLGIYSGPGPKTCAGYPASYGHEQQDANTYAKWGIDYLKYDLCSYMEIMRRQAPHDQAKQWEMMRQAYEKMHQALLKTGRPIVFSLCQYGLDDVWTWGPSVGGNLWRTTDDINDTWQRMADIGFGQLGLAKYAGPGHWNDPDMLEVGNGGMTDTEYRTHMSLWAILAAPLLSGNDLSKMTPETKAILLNKEVIAVDQDSMGKQGDRAMAWGMTEIWTKPLTDGALAAGLFNRDSEAHSVTLHLRDVGLPANAKLRDLWAHKDVSATDGSYTVTVPGHGVVLLKASR